MKKKASKVPVIARSIPKKNTNHSLTNTTKKMIELIQLDTIALVAQNHLIGATTTIQVVSTFLVNHYPMCV